MENKQVLVLVNGTEKYVYIGTYLHEILQETKEFFMPCAGHGRCGKCKILAKGVLSEPNEKECTYLTKQELERGIRLACQTKVLGSCQISSMQEGTIEVLLNKESIQQTTMEVMLNEEVVPKTTIEVTSHKKIMFNTDTVEGTKRMFETLGAAVDIGTTTLAVSLYDAHGLVGQLGAVNPQMAFGADVISRMEQSLNGKSEQLANAIQRGIADLLQQICEKYRYRVEDIDTLVIAGNTVMLYLLTKKNQK